MNKAPRRSFRKAEARAGSSFRAKYHYEQPHQCPMDTLSLYSPTLLLSQRSEKLVKQGTGFILHHRSDQSGWFCPPTCILREVIKRSTRPHTLVSRSKYYQRQSR